MRPNNKSREYLHGLDGWRAIAVLLVLAGHAPSIVADRFDMLQAGAGLGVRIFFSISGLLICSRLLDEEERCGSISLRGFYMRRVFRILPASCVYLAALVVLGSLGVVAFDWSSWRAALLFYRNYWSYWHGVDAASWFTAHFWSLSVEEHFYFLLPSLLLFFPKVRGRLLLLLSVVSFGWMFVYVTEPEASRRFLWEQRTEFCLMSLLLAAWFALQLRRPGVRAWCQRWLSPWLGVLLVGMCVTRWFHPFPSLAENELLGTFLKSVLLPLTLVSFVLHPESVLTRLWELPALRFIGRISYSLYLWQQLFLCPDEGVALWRNHWLRQPPVAIACTFVCAVLSYRFIETPLIAYGRKFAGSRTPGPDPLAEPLHAHSV